MPILKASGNTRNLMPRIRMQPHQQRRGLGYIHTKTHDHPRLPPQISPVTSLKYHRNFQTRQAQTRKPLKGLLSGQKALISGGSRGIGLAIAQRFATEGASCILLGREKETLEKALETLIPVEEGDGHSFREGDISLRDFWVELAKDDEIKKTTHLVNAAGQTHSSLLVTTTPDLLTSVIQTNLMGTLWSCQIITKLFLRQKNKTEFHPSIINISSLLATKGGQGSTAYSASKAGILGLTRSLAAEVASSGIRVNAILPGYIRTQMTDSMHETARDEALQSIPLGRFGDAAEVADAAVFLATNTYATNCVLNLDGGLSAT